MALRVLLPGMPSELATHPYYYNLSANIAFDGKNR